MREALWKRQNSSLLQPDGAKRLAREPHSNRSVRIGNSKSPRVSTLQRLLVCLGFGNLDLSIKRRTLGLNQAARIEQFRFAQPGPDQLQARNRNTLVIHWNRYRQRRISCEIHGNGILQAQHSRFQKGYSSDEWNRWRQRLKDRQSYENNFFEDLPESILPLPLPLESVAIVRRVIQFSQGDYCF